MLTPVSTGVFLWASTWDADPVAAQVLGAIQGGIGRRHQFAGGVVVRSEGSGSADAAGYATQRKRRVGVGQDGPPGAVRRCVRAGQMQPLDAGADPLGDDGRALERLV